MATQHETTLQQRWHCIKDTKIFFFVFDICITFFKNFSRARFCQLQLWWRRCHWQRRSFAREVPLGETISLPTIKQLYALAGSHFVCRFTTDVSTVSAVMCTEFLRWRARERKPTTSSTQITRNKRKEYRKHTVCTALYLFSICFIHFVEFSACVLFSHIGYKTGNCIPSCCLLLYIPYKFTFFVGWRFCHCRRWLMASQNFPRPPAFSYYSYFRNSHSTNYICIVPWYTSSKGFFFFLGGRYPCY